MKKNNKDKSTKNSGDIKKEPVTAANKIEQGGANSSFPQEYEEQLSMDIRMKPQPLVEPKKAGD